MWMRRTELDLTASTFPAQPSFLCHFSWQHQDTKMWGQLSRSVKQAKLPCQQTLCRLWASQHGVLFSKLWSPWGLEDEIPFLALLNWAWCTQLPAWPCLQSGGKSSSWSSFLVSTEIGALWARFREQERAGSLTYGSLSFPNSRLVPQDEAEWLILKEAFCLG